MPSAGSITKLMMRVQAGDDAVWDLFYERLLGRLVALARKRLLSSERKNNDAGDVVAMTLQSLLKGIRAGQFTRLRDRNDLWRLLAILVRNKTCDLVEMLPVMAPLPDCAGELLPAQRFDISETLATAGELEVQRLLGLLPESRMREIAVRTMEGYSQKEIAAMLRCSCSTVERKLRLIRKLWAGEIEP